MRGKDVWNWLASKSSSNLIASISGKILVLLGQQNFTPKSEIDEAMSFEKKLAIISFESSRSQLCILFYQYDAMNKWAETKCSQCTSLTLARTIVCIMKNITQRWGLKWSKTHVFKPCSKKAFRFIICYESIFFNILKYAL